MRTCLGVDNWRDLAYRSTSVPAGAMIDSVELELMREEGGIKMELWDEDITKKLCNAIFKLLKCGRQPFFEWYKERDRRLPPVHEFVEPAFSYLIQTGDGQGFANEYVFRLMLPFLLDARKAAPEKKKKKMKKSKEGGGMGIEESGMEENNAVNEDVATKAALFLMGSIGLECIRSIDFVLHLVREVSPAIDHLLVIRCSRLCESLLWPTPVASPRREMRVVEEKGEGGVREGGGDEGRGMNHKRERRNWSLLSFCIDSLFRHPRNNILQCLVVKVVDSIFSRRTPQGMEGEGEEAFFEEMNGHVFSGKDGGGGYRNRNGTTTPRWVTDELQRFVLAECRLIPRLLKVIRLDRMHAKEEKGRGKCGPSNMGHVVQVCNILVGNTREGKEVPNVATAVARRRRLLASTGGFLRWLGLSEEEAAEWQTFINEDLPRLNRLQAGEHTFVPPPRPTIGTSGWMAERLGI